ncbi:hypothetical protein JW977_01420 [Candidatus Falkowbacteria bacterium]|nr:hypothetical protein [Candidatus Falkowbacteria bacterium]
MNDFEKNKSDLAKAKEIDKELKNIYKQGGKMPDMGKLDHKQRSKFLGLFFLIITLLLILGVSVLGFFVFQQKPKYTGDKISLEIKAPFNAASGERISYEIKITNGEEISLTKAELCVYLPQGFIFENSSLMSKIKAPEGENPNPNIKVWQLDDLYSKQIQSIIITGKLIGQTNSKQPISATFSYFPANFNSEFQKNVSFNTDIADSLVDFELDYPSQAANLDEIVFNLKIKNKSEDTEISNVQIELNFSENFTLTESQAIQGDKKNPIVKEKLAAQAKQKLWDIDKLMPKEEWQIKFKGKFEVSESKSEEFNIKLREKGSAEEYIDQKEKNYNIEIIKGDLLTNLIINGSSQNKAFNFGDTLNCLLVIENKSKKILGDIKARLVLDSTLLDRSTLLDNNNGMVQDNQILWTKEQISQLGFIIPEGEVEIPLQIKLKDFDPSLKYKEEDLKVRSFFETQINKINDKDVQVAVQSNTLINEINTNSDLSAAIRYFADTNGTIGSGPLPPIVGQTTSYKVFLTLTNSLHEINNIKVQIKLPDYVNYAGNENISAGNLILGEQNQLIWQISRIPASVTKTTAEFEIAITPIISDANKIMTLINEIELSVIDSQTLDSIEKTITGLTTNLEADELGKNKGVVQLE